MSDPDFPETLQPGYDLIVTIQMDKAKQFTLDWNLMEHDTGWDRGSTWILSASDNPAMIVAQVGNIVVQAMRQHLEDKLK